MHLRDGDRFDRYTIEALLGEGGMGRVYRAKDHRLGRRVALKILRLESEVRDAGSSGPTSDGPARLMREARAAAAFDHPNAVAIFDVGEVSGTPYIAMELIEGRSLRSFVGDASVPVERRLQWLADVAAALGAAHPRGLVHRDVKPENVMVRADGVVKVLDYGIARHVDLDVDPTAPTSNFTTLSGAGAIVGTPLYMAPEQLRGDPVDGRADQFAWGVMAYELLGGTVPWKAGSGVQLVSEILSKEPAPLGLAPQVEATVMKTLRKSPRERFATMEEVVLALEVCLPKASSRDPRALAPTEPPPPAQAMSGTQSLPKAAMRSHRRTRWLALLLVVGVGIAGAVLLASPGSETPAAAPRHEPSAPRSTATAITDLPPPASKNEAAVAAFVTGTQAMRDASLMAAWASFRRAVAADPTMAPAHLRLAWLAVDHGDSASARAHLQSARELRAQLTERDKALLDAIDPLVVAVPPDASDAEKKLAAAEARWPGDAELAFVLGRVRQRLGRRAAAESAFDRALAADPNFAAVMWARAIDAEDAGDMDGALAAYERCLTLSAGAASCLRSRATIYAQRGECDRLEADAQRMIRIEPNGERAYQFLARALAARAKPAEAVREALQQSWRASEGDTKRRELADLAALDLLNGNFEGAEARALELAARVSEARTEIEHAEPTRLLLAAYAEMGEVKRAGEVAEAFRKRRDAWVAMRALGDSGLHGAVPGILAASRRAGLISQDTMERARAEWLREARTHLSPLWERELWVPAYAAFVETAEEAREALAALPSFQPLPPARDLTMADAALGAVYFLAGKLDEAAEPLRRGAAACIALDEPVLSTRAHAMLGQTLERSGKTREACDAYAVVLARWGSAKPRSITAATVRARASALRCPGFIPAR